MSNYRKGVAGRTQHSDEDLSPAHLAGRPIDNFHGVTSKVDEHAFACGVHLAQRRLQPADPCSV